jgi:ureidoglycolate lyase
MPSPLLAAAPARDEAAKPHEEPRMRTLRPVPLTAEAFAPFGDVLDATGDFRLINAGLCQRHHDRARLDFGPDGRAGISIFQAEPRALPYSFDLIERHPEGSQAFLPDDRASVPRHRRHQPRRRPPGLPDQRRAGHQPSPRHLARRADPPSAPGLFAVVDRIGTTPNLEEHRYSEAWTVLAP